MTDKETLIEKYLHGELSETEFQEFEQQVTSDADFADEVKLRSVIFAKAKSDFKQQLRDAHQAKEATPSIPKIKPLYYVKRIAAVFIFGVIAFALYHFLGKTNSGDLADTYLAETHTDPTVVMGKTDDEKAWQLAVAAFQQDDYAKAVRSIKNIPSPDTEQQFYLGLGNLYQSDYLAAIAAFESLIRSENRFAESAKWYISLAYLKNNQPGQAKKHLQDIVNVSSWKAKEAQTLLDTL